MAMLRNTDAMFNDINQELNKRYGKGEIYQNYDHLSFHGETFTHVTEDRIKRTFELDKYALEGNRRGKEHRDPIRLIEIDHSHQLQSLSIPYHSTNPTSSFDYRPPDVYVEERDLDEIVGGCEELKPKKKSKLVDELQKETDNWLKSVQKEAD